MTDSDKFPYPPRLAEQQADDCAEIQPLKEMAERLGPLLVKLEEMQKEVAKFEKVLAPLLKDPNSPVEARLAKALRVREINERDVPALMANYAQHLEATQKLNQFWNTEVGPLQQQLQVEFFRVFSLYQQHSGRVRIRCIRELAAMLAPYCRHNAMQLAEKVDLLENLNFTIIGINTSYTVVGKAQALIREWERLQPYFTE
jgi:hypothetical protein